MNKKIPGNQSISLDKTIEQKLLQVSNFHYNLEQDLIIITEDKIKLCLIEYIGSLSKKDKWKYHLEIFITIILVFITADFKSFVFNRDVWTAIFFISGCITLFFLIISIFQAFKNKASLEELMLALKKISKETKERT
jgi:hypothetical protein